MYYEHTSAGGRRPVLVFVEPCHTLATVAYGAAMAGIAHLTQHRRGEGDYAYIATRTAATGDTTQAGLVAAANTATEPYFPISNHN